jgi:succinyl-CoA synthetase alpha subunit
LFLNDNPIINGLDVEWENKTYCNPPYSKPLPWINKAIEENKKGKIGIVSKSGTLTYEAADQIVKAGLGVSTAIGIVGDPIIGTPTKDAVELLMNDPDTDAIVMIGEIGGNYEAEAARWIKTNGNKKPVVGFIAGQTAPKGRTMGHAGAIVGGAEDTAQAKMQIMSEC